MPASMALPAKSTPSKGPDPDALSQFLYPTHRDMRSRIEHVLNEPLFARRYDLTVAQQRTLTNARLARLCAAGFFAGTLTAGSSEGGRRYEVLVDMVSMVDHSLEVKIGVSFGLCGASIRALGSPQQKAYWLPRIESMQAFGCFALSELGHGSNVRGIETTATYDHSTSQFLIHTPTESAQKYWIGGAAESANIATVFAKLIVNGTHHGIHLFLVTLRDHNGSVNHGIQIADCGPKAGLNGVDNGRIWFTHHRIPRTAMLSALSEVTENGEFRATVTNADARFGKMLAALTGGRISIAFNSVAAALLGLTIAIRYSYSRRAFAPSKHAEEVPLMYYTSQRRALMLPLASAFVYFFCVKDLREEWYRVIDGAVVSKDTHTTSAGYKALFSWFMMDALQNAREACGGQGYKADNEIAPLKADRDVMVTFEGANGVLLQQVGKQMLSDGMAAAKKGWQVNKHSALWTHDDDDDDDDDEDDDDEKEVATLSTRFVGNAMRQREMHLVKELVAKYAKSLTRHNGQGFQAWNECLDVAQRAGVAHIQRRIWQAHRRHVREMVKSERGCGDALRLCGSTWASAVIAKDPDFLRLGCISRNEAHRVVEDIDHLCQRMNDIAPALLKAVGYADHLLAPIARDYVRHNSRAML